MSSNAIVAIDTLNDELNRVAEHLLESFEKFEGDVDIFSQQRYEALVEETKACLRKHAFEMREAIRIISKNKNFNQICPV